MASRPPLVILSALGERQNCCSPGSLQMSSKPLAVGRPMPFYATGTLSSSWPPSMWKISPLLVLSPWLHSPSTAVAPSAGLGRVFLSPPLPSHHGCACLAVWVGVRRSGSLHTPVSQHGFPGSVLSARTCLALRPTHLMEGLSYGRTHHAVSFHLLVPYSLSPRTYIS